MERILISKMDFFDNIILSLYMGLTTVAIYGNYYYIYAALYGFMGIIIHGISASVGNAIATESVQKNYNDMRMFNFIFMVIVGWCTVCMYCLYQPFMRIWMHDNSAMMFSELDMTLFCVYFYAINMTYVRSMYLDGKGLFYECRFWCVIEALGNLFLNVILGKIYGVTGIIIATIVTIIIFNLIGRTYVLYRYYFKKGMVRFYKDHLLYISVTVVIAFFVKIFLDCISFRIINDFIVRCIMCFVLAAIGFCVAYLKYPLTLGAKQLFLKMRH